MNLNDVHDNVRVKIKSFSSFTSVSLICLVIKYIFPFINSSNDTLNKEQEGQVALGCSPESHSEGKVLGQLLLTNKLSASGRLNIQHDLWMNDERQLTLDIMSETKCHENISLRPIVEPAMGGLDCL